MEILVLITNALIWLIIIRQLLPPPKLDYGGEPLVCISAGKVFDNQRLYFCSQGVFVYRKKVMQAHHTFETMKALEKSSLKINNTKVWSIRFDTKGRPSIYDFRPRYRGFKQFYLYVRQNYPDIAISNWNKWLD
ncbi:MAG: hypothetical protein Q3966_05660 [Neisseria sp.]|nr:hypothetical protein [Neisseria sp.]